MKAEEGSSYENESRKSARWRPEAPAAGEKRGSATKRTFMQRPLRMEMAEGEDVPIPGRMLSRRLDPSQSEATSHSDHFPPSATMDGQ